MKLWKVSSLVAASVISTSSNAALVERLGGLAYYDTEAGLTWLADANFSQSSGYDNDGRLNWDEANAWAAGLDIAGVAGWRLPNADITCRSTNCTNSELGNMFYNVLGGVAFESIHDTHNENYYLFSNIRTEYPEHFQYWSGSEHPSEPSIVAYGLSFGWGTQYYSDKTIPHYVWAVYDGDVAEVSSVPLPTAAWLFGSGLIGILGFAKRKKHK